MKATITMWWFFTILLLLTLQADHALATDVNDSSSVGVNASDSNVPSHHRGGGGIPLASWRWREYDSIAYFTLIILIASILKIGFHHIPRLAAHFPESCVLIVFGMFLGCVLEFSFPEGAHRFPKFTSDLFFNVLLPPIILDASFSMYDEDFFGNIDAILLFAVVGTVFNVFLVALGMFSIGAVGLLNLSCEVSFLHYLVFATIVSAVDPVAVLAIFEEIHVNSVLYFLVFGESLLNDGVTIVLYNTLITLSLQEQTDYTQYILAVASFFTVVFGGLLVGITTGVANAVILRLTKKDHIRVLEPLVIVTSAYFSYILAEIFHWSGIISLIGCGIMQKRYAFLNASKKTYTTVKYTVKTLASVADSVIFIFLGKAAVRMFKDLEFHVEFICWSLLFCTLVRFGGVFLLSQLTNRRRTKPISLREQFIMAYGGLRGAVSFSLAYILTDSNPMKDIFLTTTLIVIFFTVFIQGGTIKILVDKLHITMQAEKDKKHIFCDVHKKATDYLMAGVETILGNISMGSYFHIIQTFDERYVKKMLVRKRVKNKMTLRLEKITLDEHYARLYGPNVLALMEEEELEDVVEEVEVMEEELEAIPEEKAEESAESSEVNEVEQEEQEKKTVTLSLPRISTAVCLESLDRGFKSNPYERYMVRKVAMNEALEDEEDYEDEAIVEQLNYRTLQTRNIERKLMKADSFQMESDGGGGYGGGASSSSSFSATANAVPCSSRRCRSISESTTGRSTPAGIAAHCIARRCRSVSRGEERSPAAGGGGADEDCAPMLPMRTRTCSCMSASEIRKKYLLTKRKSK